MVVDNPVGTGLSYGAPGELVNTTEMMAEYLYNGLKNLFTLDGRNNTCNMQQYNVNDFHVSGESYGGHWIPGIAEKIIIENEKSVLGF